MLPGPDKKRYPQSEMVGSLRCAWPLLLGMITNKLSVYLQSYIPTTTSLSTIRRGFAPGFVNYKKGALDSQPQGIKFTSCLLMVGGSLRVFQLLPPLKLVAMI